MENKDLKTWFSFSKKERNALILLVVLVGFFFLVPFLFPKKESLFAVAGENKAKNTVADTNGSGKNIPELFVFDPNTLDAAGWKKLGLRDKTVQTILHYREKGGKFRQPEDIRKIYGLHHDDANRLIPFIHIGQQPDIVINKHTMANKTNSHYSFPLEVNKAGADHWAALPGISPGLAQRIVHYRAAVKGFKSIDQVGKTYGLSPETFAQIKPLLRLAKEDTAENIVEKNDHITEKETVINSIGKNAHIERININTASEQELLAQKRIPRNVAKALVIYREQHGLYQQVADIRKIVFINDDLYEKIAPYLKVE